MKYPFLIFLTCFLYNHPNGSEADVVGINYGLLGNNLPPPPAVVSQLHQIGVGNIRIFQPDNSILTALHNSSISVIIGTYNEDLRLLALDPSAATAWVATNILPHDQFLTFTCIAAGNEVYPGELVQFIPGAMQNLQSSLRAANLSIPVSTTVSMMVLQTSYPPSAGIFYEVMVGVARFLSANNYPLLVNVYPYFARVGNPVDVALDYALFRRQDVVVRDGAYNYSNLFDAMVDSAYAALEKVGASNVEIIVTETGWPTAGGVDASVENTQTYINNLIRHVPWGTPRRPGREIKSYIFAMFNENLKPGGVEQHWGLYNPDLTPAYQVGHF